jgi:hypothetical protein
MSLSTDAAAGIRKAQVPAGGKRRLSRFLNLTSTSPHSTVESTNSTASARSKSPGWQRSVEKDEISPPEVEGRQRKSLLGGFFSWLGVA